MTAKIISDETRARIKAGELWSDDGVRLLHAIEAAEAELAVLGNVLRRLRWDDQGGYPGLHNGKWTFASTCLPATTPEELNVLFKLAGIVPDEIRSLGHCAECAHARTYSDGTRDEQGYAGPCSACKRPRMSNFVPMGALAR